MTATWPQQLLTLEEWSRLPQDEHVRSELVEGWLTTVPKPDLRHQRAGMLLGYRLDEQLPSDLTAVTDVEVVIEDTPPTVRVPDVVVTTTEVAEANPTRLTAAQALLAVELLSDGTRKVDRILKFAEYAEAGIPQYWIVDLDAPATLLAYTLVDGQYELSGEYTGVVTLPVAGQPVTIDLDALVRRR